MSDKIVPIPSYKTSCLAADEGSNYFYLICSAAPGLLDVNYVPDIFAKTVRQQATISDMNAWSPAAEKAAVKIIQFGIAQTWFSTFQDNTIKPATYANSPPSSNAPNNGTVRVTFLSAKLLAWTGISADYDMFTLYTDFKYGPQGTQWAALSLGFGSNSSLLFDYRLSTIPVSDPLLTLGTFAPANGGNSSGYTIVFDKNKQGMLYSTFACSSAIPAGDPLMTLSGQTSVGMNNIVLTKYAIPVTMASTGYVLDQAADNITTIIYSITPSESPNLSQVDIKGGQTLQFSTSMSAAALGSKIIVYSAPDGAKPYFNSFDTATGKWAGDNLISNSNNNSTISDGKNNEQATPLGAIIGGVVGGLVAIALAMFLLIRRQRRQSAQKNADSAELVKLSSDENTNAGSFDPGYVQYGPGYVQYDHGYVPHDQGYGQGEQQHQGYQLSPTFFPPPPTPVVNQDSDMSNKVDATDSVTSNPYVSPTSYRDSISFPPVSPESILAKSEVSSTTHGPQYVPSAPVSPSNARSPQSQYDPGYIQYDQAQSPYVQAQVQYDPNQAQYSQGGQGQYGRTHALPDQGYVPYEHQAYQHPSPFIPPPPPVNQDANISYKVYQPESTLAVADIDASYKVPHSDLTEDSIHSPTVVNSSSYISPGSYRDSFQPGSPESVRVKVSSGIIQGPQAVPNAPVAVTEARSPQVVPSTIIGH